jgi:hypothetical protein
MTSKLHDWRENWRAGGFKAPNSLQISTFDLDVVDAHAGLVGLALDHVGDRDLLENLARGR